MKKLILGFAIACLSIIPSFAIAEGAGTNSLTNRHQHKSPDVPNTVYGNYNSQIGKIDSKVFIANGIVPNFKEGGGTHPDFENVIIANVSNAGPVNFQYSRINGVEFPDVNGLIANSVPDEDPADLPASATLVAYGASGSVSETHIGHEIDIPVDIDLDLELKLPKLGISFWPKDNRNLPL